MAIPSGPHTAASPSIVNDLARKFAAARAIAGYRSVQPDHLALPANLQPVAVVLDLMRPIGTDRRLGGAGGNAGGDEAVARTGSSGLLELSECRGIATGATRMLEVSE